MHEIHFLFRKMNLVIIWFESESFFFSLSVDFHNNDKAAYEMVEKKTYDLLYSLCQPTTLNVAFGRLFDDALSVHMFNDYQTPTIQKRQKKSSNKFMEK